MPNICQFKYFLYDRRHPAEKESEIWQTPLPMKPANSRHVETHGRASLRVGEYFCAVRGFWERSGVRGQRFEGRGQGAKQSSLTPHPEPRTSNPISIFLEKHGEFYHPARIEVIENGEKKSFAVNVAVSDTGKAHIRQEYDTLKRLNRDFPEYSFLPKVYEYGEIRIGNGAEIPMFLGEWFEGFHEFHLSCHPQERKNRIIVWDAENGNFFLSLEQTLELYAHAAMMLTCYYDAETFDQIYPWHHAAGDFIVKVQNDAAPITADDVKLITVRQYRQASEAEKPDANAVLDALLAFFLNLSIRMRLDRLDGVGETAWADEIAVQGTVAGFFRGLAMKAPVSVLPAPLDLCFQYYFLQRTEAELFELSEAVMNAYSPDSAEFPVIKKHLKEHTAALCRAVISELGE